MLPSRWWRGFNSREDKAQTLFESLWGKSCCVWAPEESFSFGGHGKNSKQQMCWSHPDSLYRKTNKKKRSIVLLCSYWNLLLKCILSLLYFSFCADFKSRMSNTTLHEIASSGLGNSLAADGRMHHVAVVRDQCISTCSFFGSVHCVFKNTIMMIVKSVHSVLKITKMITMKYGRWWSKLLYQAPSPFLLTPSSRQPRRCQGPSQIVLREHWKLVDQDSSIWLCLAKSPRPNSARSWQMASCSTPLLMEKNFFNRDASNFDIGKFSEFE